jgi:hypothetical protein
MRLPETSALYMMEMQPPPPAARLSASFTPINSRFTELRSKLLFMVLTDTASTTPMAPPHAEHAKVAFGQVTELFLNEVDTTVRELEIAPIAPPICAKLSRKVQSVTETMLL